jgi:hypothetical protein
VAQADHTPIDTEQKLRRAIPTGTPVDLCTGEAEVDDPAQGATWDRSRTVPAALLAELLTRPGEGSTRPRALRLAGARITGILDLKGIELVCPLLLRGCWFDEPVNLAGVKISVLSLPGCHIPGLDARQIQTQGDLSLNGAVIKGQLFLAGGRIGGSLRFSEATLTNPNNGALLADAVVVGENVYCDELKTRGEVDLDGAAINGFADFTGAKLDNANGLAFHAESMSTGRSLLLWEGFYAHGEVSLIRAQIGGSLDFSNATLDNQPGYALDANGLTVAHNVAFRGNFTAQGEVSLLDVRIGGMVDFSGATLINPGKIALNLQQSRIPRLYLQPQATPQGMVDLIHAEVDVLADDVNAWPSVVGLTGFVYQALRERTRFDVGARLRWLERNADGYSPQPYEQLAAVYRRAGREEDARRVAIAKQRQRRRELSLPGKLWSLLLGALIGHGYRTWFAAGWLLLMLAVGTLVYQQAYPAQMRPATPGEPAPTFQPAVYALDVLLPVVDLDQQAHWIPLGVARWWTWTSILAGWLLTTAVVAALTGLLRKE